MARSTSWMRWLFACAILSGSLGAQNDTTNGTAIYKLALGSAASSRTTSSIGLDSSESQISSTSSLSASSSSSTRAESTSNATSTSPGTHDGLHGFAQTAPSSGLPTLNGYNATTSYESTSYITELVTATITTSIPYSNVSNATRTANSNATITTPPWRNLTTTLPAGIGTLGNATFHSSCAYSDTACYSTCSVNFDSCSYSWGQYSVLYQSFLASASAEGLVTVSATSSTTVSYIYTLTSYLATTISTATSIFRTPTTYTAITSKARSECQYITQTFTSPYTVTMATNNCSDNEIYSTFTTTVVSTSTGLFGENNGQFTYATATVGVYTTSTRTDVVDLYTTMAPSFSIAAPQCHSAGCVQEAQAGCGDQAWSCTVGPNCDMCTIYGGTVQLLYWPVSTSTAAANGSVANTTSSQTVTQMSTAVYEGYTLVSPSVYISFETAYAMNDCNSTIGQAHTGSIIGLDPADLSSAVGNQHYLSYSPASGTVSAVYSMAAAPFNLNNLNWPYNPWAYLNQPSCNTRGGLNYDFDCHVILEDSYFPVLVVPDEIRNMDPAWASCALDWEGLYDPPLALQPATAPASVTLPRPRTSTEAASTTPASAAATPTSPAAETSPPTSARASTPTTPAATGREPTPTAEADQTDENESNPTSADPDDASDQTQADPSHVATAAPTTTGIGDFIASVIGLVPSAAAGESAEEANEGGNAQPTSVDTQDPSDDDDSETGNESNNQATAQTTLGGDAGSPGQDGSAGTAPWNGSPAVSTQNNVGSGAPIVTFVADGSTFTATQIGSDAAVVGGNTLSVGGSATVVAGQTVSFGSDGIVAASGGSTTAIQFVDPGASAASPAAAPVATFVADGTTYTAAQADGSSGSTAVLNDGATLSVGGAATTLAGGQTVSLGADGIVVNNGDSTSTAAFAAPASAGSQEATFVAGGTTYTAIQTGGAGTAVLGGAKLSQGGPAATLANGETVSLGTAGLVVVDGDTTSTAGFRNAQATSAVAQQATFTIDGTIYTALATGGSGTVVIDGQTLSVGGSAITVDGQTISLGPSGIIIAANGITTTAHFAASATPTNWIPQAIITAGSSTLTAYGLASESGKIILDGTTLTQGGGPVTINGEIFSLGKDGLVESEDGKKTTLSGLGVSTPHTSASKSSKTSSSHSSRLVTSPASRASSSSVRETASSTTSAGCAVHPRNWMMGLALLSVMLIFM